MIVSQDFPCFQLTWEFWEMAIFIIQCPSAGICLKFFSWWGWGYGVGVEPLWKRQHLVGRGKPRTGTSFKRISLSGSCWHSRYRLTSQTSREEEKGCSQTGGPPGQRLPPMLPSQATKFMTLSWLVITMDGMCAALQSLRRILINNKMSH